MIKSEKINWATDDKFKDIWKDQNGLIIGRGIEKDYIRKKYLDDFNGKVIGCNTAFNTRKCDAIVLMDEKIFYNNRKIYKELSNNGTYIFVLNPIYPLYGVDVIGIESRKPERCSDSFDIGFYPCKISGYIAVNIAILLGLNPIYLYGFTPNLLEKRNIAEKSLDFELIANYCYKNDINIYTISKDPVMELFFEYKPIKTTKMKRKV